MQLPISKCLNDLVSIHSSNVHLKQGGTHQIRVHMKYIGHPLVGDPKYGCKETIEFGGQVLHAGTLGFEHPETGEYMEFTAEPPADLKKLITKFVITLTNRKSNLYTEAKQLNSDTFKDSPERLGRLHGKYSRKAARILLYRFSARIPFRRYW